MKDTNSQITELNLPRTIHLVPMDYISGFAVRPGFYETNGATAIPGGVNSPYIPTVQLPSSFSCSTEKKANHLQSCHFRLITGSGRFTP